jgi:O-acetyl-ADP-ribose deacetylase (regulator of RNase III)
MTYLNKKSKEVALMIHLHLGDITTIETDAIVNAANNSLLGGGGVDGAIHSAAGPGLLAECRTLSGCITGQSKITKGYNLKALYVIHTVGPIWRDGSYDEDNLLASCYRTALCLAKEYNLKSIAFPSISTGAFGFPKERAMAIAIKEVVLFLHAYEMEVWLVCYDKDTYDLYMDIATEFKSRPGDSHIC